MRKWNLIVDVAKCEDCNNCFLACKDEHVDNDWPGYTLAQPRHGHRWMNIMRRERGVCPMIDVAYRPTPCMHCDNAPCIEKALNQAVYKRRDGIVIIDPEKATGQKDLVKACPYGAIYWNKEKNVPQKCTFCAHLLDKKWQKPRCVQSCPTGALRAEYVDDAEMNRLVAAEQLEVLHSELGTQPRVYYKSLYRYSSCFIGGSVAIDNGGVVDCAEGAKVALYHGGDRIAEAITCHYGDFKFDGLAKNSGEYFIVAEVAGLGTRTVRTLVLESSLYLGVISFSAAAEEACHSDGVSNWKSAIE